MNGIEIKGVTLFLAKIPKRKGLCFYFQEGNSIYPVAYVSDKLEPVAIDKWNKMIEGLK